MKNLFLYFLLLTVSQLSKAQTESFEWVKQIPGNVQIRIMNSILDHQKNTLLTGDFDGTFDFDTGSGVDYLVSDSSSDGFLAKYSHEGNYIWSKHFKSDQEININSINLDSEGNIILCGNFLGTVDLDPGIGIVNFSESSSSLGAHSFICKLDSLGNYLWAKDMQSSHANSIAIDEFGNIHITGGFTGTVDFDPDSTINQLTSGFYGGDTYILKLDNNGEFIWVKQFYSGTTVNYGVVISLDDSHNILTTGRMNGNTDFDPTLDNNYDIDTNGEEDLYICKLDSDGDFIWAKNIGGVNNDRPSSLLTDQYNNIYLTGYFQDSIDIDPGLNIQTINSTGNFNSFLLKLDSAGNYNWSIPYQSLQEIYVKNFTFDALGDIYTTGDFKGTVDFDPSPNSFTLNSVNQGVFIQKLNSLGEFVWAKKITSEDEKVSSASICVDDSFEVYTTGGFTGYTDFGVGTPNQFLNKVSQFYGYDFDGFIHKISQPISTVGISELNTVGQYTISPNPATNFVQLSLGGQHNYQITILDITGKHKERLLSDQENLTLDVSKYTPGIYFINIKDKYGAEVLKLVVE